MNIVFRKCYPKLLIRRNSSFANLFSVSEEVEKALRDDKPILALESTIITHGMPFPINLDTAVQVEHIVRRNGAVPATIAVLNGVIKIGLSPQELELLSQSKNSVKISRRDLPFAATKCLTGGTTVSATMLIAHKAGIKCFATGGIGGVHRGAEVTFDVSADLRELGRTPVTVFSSGIKSILDIEKSLEFLETEGVAVTVFNNRDNNCDFPGFYTSKSGLKVPFCVKDVNETAVLVHNHERLNLENGILVAVPVPQKFDDQSINEAITLAVSEAREKGMKGKEVTPFLLSRVSEITKGESLRANVALIKNNADIGSQVVCALNNLRIHLSLSSKNRNHKSQIEVSQTKSSEPSVVVIGGSIWDVMLNVAQETVELDETTVEANVKYSVGGVARNLADCISRLGHSTFLISCVGNDESGKYILQQNSALDKEGIKTTNEVATSTAYVITDKNGESKLTIIDKNAHRFISKEHVAKFAENIRKSSIVLMDANTPLSTMEYVLSVCYESGVPVFYEPTDPRLASKIIQIKTHIKDCIVYASPNFLELRFRFEALTNKQCNLVNDSPSDIQRNCQKLGERILDDYFQTLLIKLGKHGNVVLSKKPLFDCLNLGPSLNFTGKGCDTFFYHFSAKNIAKSNIVNSSGAGDCFVGGFVSGIMHGCSLEDCIKRGQSAAIISLKSKDTVPIEIESMKLKKTNF